MKPASELFSPSLKRLFGLALSLSILLLAASTATASPSAQNAQCFNAPVSDDPTATVCISRVVVVFDGTHPDNRFYVSWRTRNSEGGRVRLVGGGTFADERGADYEGKTHYVKVNNLAADGKYQFDIISGGKTYNNGGQHWAVNLGPAVSAATTPYTIFGRLKNPDGSDADGAIVYVAIRDADDNGTSGRSGLLSTLIRAEDGGDFFNINLEEARTRNNASKFNYDPARDQVVINAVGAEGSASENFKISDLHPPKPPPTFTLNESGTGAAATATPTIQPTETPIPTETPTETPVPPELTATPIRLTATPRPRPPTSTPFVEPTLEEPGPTSAAVKPTEAEETVAAPTVVEDQTRIAINPAQPEQTLDSNDAPEPSRTRVIRGATATPVAVASNPFLSSNALFTALALVFVVGAILLGLVAFIVWKR